MNMSYMANRRIQVSIQRLMVVVMTMIIYEWRYRNTLVNNCKAWYISVALVDMMSNGQRKC